MFEPLDTNEDLKIEKDDVEFDGDDCLNNCWGLYYKYPSNKLIARTRQEIGQDVTSKLLPSKKIDNNKGDVNGVMLAPSCTRQEFGQDATNKLSPSKKIDDNKEDVNGVMLAPSCDLIASPGTDIALIRIKSRSN
jgi:hypothetical protein